jgi:hypothetical protein
MNFVDELIHTLDRHSSRFRFLRYETLKMALCCRMTFVAKTFRKTQGSLNLLDGESLTIDKKYGDAIKLRYKGSGR